LVLVIPQAHCWQIVTGELPHPPLARRAPLSRGGEPIPI
jgi:hypothetical protein